MSSGMGAKEKVLEYLKQHLNKWIHNQELRRVSLRGLAKKWNRFSLSPQSRQELRGYSIHFQMKIYRQTRYSSFQREPSAGNKLCEE